MILTGKQILEEIQQGKIEITNFNEKNLNPNSYDVTLADDLAFYTEKELDMHKNNNYRIVKITDDGYLLEPNVLYLARTNEKTITDHFAPMIEGRSSVGRLGIQIHSTAGFGDVGFNGYWTLEITVAQPVKIYPNVRIGQVYFHEVKGEIDLYKGKYQDNNELQGSMMYKDFDVTDINVENIATDICVDTKEPTKNDLALMKAYHTIYGFKWFAKDKNECVNCFHSKPMKREKIWYNTSDEFAGIILDDDLSHLSWSDKEPYEYKPEIEWEIGMEIWHYEDGVIYRAIISEISIYKTSCSCECIITDGMYEFSTEDLGVLFFLTKESCEEYYGKK